MRTKTFRRRADADAYRCRVEADELVGIVTDLRKGADTLNEVADLWLGSVPGKRPRSVERDRSVLDCHIRPLIGQRPIRSITRADVQAVPTRH